MLFGQEYRIYKIDELVKIPKAVSLLTKREILHLLSSNIFKISPYGRNDTAPKETMVYSFFFFHGADLDAE